MSDAVVAAEAGQLEHVLPFLSRLGLPRVADALKDECVVPMVAQRRDTDNNPCAPLRLACRAGRQLANVAVTDIRVRWGMTTHTAWHG